MSLQIEIAMSDEDEFALVRQLNGLSPMLYHSRIFNSGSYAPRPFAPELGGLLEFFMAEHEPHIRAHVSDVQGRTGFEQIGSFNGLSIEWHRTEWRTSNTCIPGRLYLDDRKPVSEAVADELRKLMRRVMRTIREGYPRKSPDSHACYIGPDLWRRVENGEVRVLYAGGKEIPLVPNLP